MSPGVEAIETVKTASADECREDQRVIVERVPRREPCHRRQGRRLLDRHLRAPLPPELLHADDELCEEVVGADVDHRYPQS